MGGGLMQLVAYGAQDIYLTGNPQITFFKVVYRRHTNFSMEAIEQTVSGSIALGSRNTATISRNGDLLGRMYWQIAINNDGTGTINPGHTIFDEVKLEIGGQEIDKQYGHFMEVHAQLTEPNDGALAGTQAASTVNGTKFQNMAGAGGIVGADASPTYFVPLRFWFCRNAGLYLPLIALQYHEVKVITTFQSDAALALTADSCKLWADYVYLDTDERRRFAQVSHEYLIEQVQHQTTAAAASADLNFNHPVKELIWAGAYTTSTGSFAALGATTYKLKLNGHDRFEARPTAYFTKVQVYEHHTGTPVSLVLGTLAAGAGKASATSVAVYSFALKPEEHQPSGTCNFSRIDNAQLLQTGATEALNVYAINYNVLRIMSGMGGLAYSN
jgi:hypothetical protein